MQAQLRPPATTVRTKTGSPRQTGGRIYISLPAEYAAGRQPYGSEVFRGKADFSDYRSWKGGVRAQEGTRNWQHEMGDRAFN